MAAIVRAAMEAQLNKPPPEPERPPDPEEELAAPLNALPKWEAEHVFKLATPVQAANGRCHH